MGRLVSRTISRVPSTIFVPRENTVAVILAVTSSRAALSSSVGTENANSILTHLEPSYDPFPDKAESMAARAGEPSNSNNPSTDRLVSGSSVRKETVPT